jgi:exodeoxyribonuclease VII small subunit
MKEKKVAQSAENPPETLSYEQAFAELEGIVAALETGEQTLEASMALFERGQALARYCTTRLDQAELKIQQLTGGILTDYTLQE